MLYARAPSCFNNQSLDTSERRLIVERLNLSLLFTVLLQFLHAAQLIDNPNVKLRLVYCPAWHPLIFLAPCTVAFCCWH